MAYTSMKMLVWATFREWLASLKREKAGKAFFSTATFILNPPIFAYIIAGSALIQGK
jgi:hypothetical protein